MTHKFIVNDENNVNEYGYRVMTDGIDTNQFMRNPIVLYMHNRAWDDPSKVVGRAIALEKKNGQLIIEVEFDEEDKFAKKLSKKVEGGFIKMASFYADIQETSTDPALALAGQTFETVTKCKMVEMSIVDVGGNDNALKLSRNGKPVTLAKLETKPENHINMDIKSIALSLGMDADTKPEMVQAKVAAIKLAKDNAEARVAQLENSIKASQTQEAKTLLDKAVTLGLLPEGLKDSQMKAFETDFEGQKVVLTKLITDKEAETEQDGKHTAVKEVVLRGKRTAGNGGTAVELSFDYLQKHDPAELRRLRDEDNATYVKLAKEYEGGKRYVAKN